VNYKDEMYQKLLLYSNELEDRIDELNNLNEKISLALESAEYRLDKAIKYIEEQSKFIKGCDIYQICNKDVLLGILKGVDKE